MTYQGFVGELTTRQRWWARSLVGWRRFGQAQPNAAHHALARLEQQDKLTLLLTQNVDLAAPDRRQRKRSRPARASGSGALSGLRTTHAVHGFPGRTVATESGLGGLMRRMRRMATVIWDGQDF